MLEGAFWLEAIEAGVPPSTAPYTGTLQFYGCTNVDSASYYRLRFTYTAPGTTIPSALTPFTGLSWPLYREVGATLEEQWPVADANGWYPVINPADGWFPNNMVLEWDTINSTFNANGLYHSFGTAMQRPILQDAQVWKTKMTAERDGGGVDEVPPWTGALEEKKLHLRIKEARPRT